MSENNQEKTLQDALKSFKESWHDLAPMPNYIKPCASFVADLAGISFNKVKKLISKK